MYVSGVLLGLLLSVASCSANSVRAPLPKARALQPWLVGLTAVVGFLFIVFILLIVKRLLKKKRGEEEEEDEDEESIHRVVEEVDNNAEKQTSF